MMDGEIKLIRLSRTRRVRYLVPRIVDNINTLSASHIHDNDA